ncbi:MAG: SGNH/GDSL hydrolase family protein [Patescibacteria group bacterium]
MWPLIVIIAGLLLIGSIRILIVKRSVTTYKNYWNKLAETSYPTSSLLYVALGDSAAQGIGASKPQKGYVGLIASELETQYGNSVRVINLSFTGAKVQDVINEQLPALKKLPIDKNTIITLGVGANDTGNFEESKFRVQIENLFSQLPAQTIVADIPYFGGGRHNKREQSAINGSVIIRESAQKNGIKVADLHDITKLRDDLSTYAVDFFHPNDKGYRNWYEAFRQPLNL